METIKFNENKIKANKSELLTILDGFDFELLLIQSCTHCKTIEDAKNKDFAIRKIREICKTKSRKLETLSSCYHNIGVYTCDIMTTDDYKMVNGFRMIDIYHSLQQTESPYEIAIFMSCLVKKMFEQ